MAVVGRQPAIQAWCCTSAEETKCIEEAVIRQRKAATAKMCNAIKLAKEEAEANQIQPAIKMKKVRLEMTASIKWNRKTMAKSCSRQDGIRQVEVIGTTVPQYESRKLRCPQCPSTMETNRKQLRTEEGYRALHCRMCKLQARCGWFKCQCEVIWHHCPIHRIDPPMHWSQRPAEGDGRREAKKVRKEELTPHKGDPRRKAPEMPEEEVTKN